jgi:hypothetical protein
MTKRLVVKLTRAALRRLKRTHTMRVKLAITATGPTGLKATVRRNLKLKARHT